MRRIKLMLLIGGGLLTAVSEGRSNPQEPVK